METKDHFKRKIANDLARISLDDGGTLLLPARTPYDWEIVLDHVRYRLQRDPSRVWLEVNGNACGMRRASADRAEECAACGCAIGWLACDVRSRTVCARCALQGVSGEAAGRIGSLAG